MSPAVSGSGGLPEPVRPPVANRTLLSREALAIAPRLIGAVVTSEIDGVEVAIRLTEVEAYEGARDPASHAYRGPTRRNAVMFGPPGHLYCYFTYGMHWCANIVCGHDGFATAVLLRAGDVIRGAEAAAQRRPAARRPVELARGPARLATCLGLSAAHNGLDLCDPGSPVRLESVPARRRRGVRSGPRVGITQAADRPWRFWLADAASVSAYKAGGRKRPRSGPAD